jgi:hypothetical protein
MIRRAGAQQISQYFSDTLLSLSHTYIYLPFQFILENLILEAMIEWSRACGERLSDARRDNHQTTTIR